MLKVKCLVTNDNWQFISHNFAFYCRKRANNCVQFVTKTNCMKKYHFWRDTRTKNQIRCKSRDQVRWFRMLNHLTILRIYANSHPHMTPCWLEIKLLFVFFLYVRAKRQSSITYFLHITEKMSLQICTVVLTTCHAVFYNLTNEKNGQRLTQRLAKYNNA